MTDHLRQVADSSALEAPVDDLPNFDLFFEEHRRRLYGAFCLITGNHHEAEEIVQDAFLKAWERWDRVGGLDDPVGFVFTTAMNVFRNRARRATLAVRKMMIASLRTDDLAAVEDRMELIAVLRALTPRQRAAVVLTDYLGYPAVEAAKVLGIEPSTVRSLSTKARDAARQVAEGRS